MTIKQAKFYLKEGMPVYTSGFRCAVRVRGIRRGQNGTEVLCAGQWSLLAGRKLMDAERAVGV